MVIYLWFITPKYDGWALIGVWAAIRMNNKVFLTNDMVLSHW